MSRSVLSRPARSRGVLVNVLLAAAAVLLTHVFLVRIPSHLVVRVAGGGDPARAAAPTPAVPGWSAPVETVSPRGSGAGAGAVREGVPAAPDRD